jgi:hypothetical protein
MKITLGLCLDGERGWRAADRLGAPVCGPLGLLDLLETRLGLLQAPCAPVLRVTQYRECLARMDGASRFFHASFGLDPIHSAATLLAWRDAWHLHGWTGAAPEAAGSRVADMASVETVARELLAPSVGERLARVAKALTRQRAGIESVELVEPLEAFPGRWREVLASLPMRAMPACGACAGPGSTLGQLQRALLALREGRRGQRLAWHEDGSLRVVRAQTRLLGARWLAHELAAAREDTVLVAGSDRTLLDASFDAADVPRQGFRQPDAAAPALQLLPLALATVWAPLDVHALLQFLVHPLAPFPHEARHRLAEVLAQHPGVGGPRWREAVAALAAAQPARAAELERALALWVDGPRHAEQPGAPIQALLQRTQVIADACAARLAGEDACRSAAAATALAHARELGLALQMLQAQGQHTLARTALRALLVLAQCTGQGAADAALQAQAGRVPAVTDPGALLEPFSRVVWWQPGAAALPAHDPWSPRELALLARAGMQWPSPAKRLQWRGDDWLRPVLNARDELVLVLPPQDEEPHPLWQQIQGLVEGLRPAALEDLLHGGDGLPALAHAPLPARRRWWQLPPEVKLAPRARESYSSLALFLDAPHRWVLKYAARLEPSRLLAVADANLLYGNLAHRLFERLFRREDAFTLKGDALRAWFEAAFATVLAEEGAVLLMPGRHAERERLRLTLWRAITECLRQFEAAGAAAATPERALAGSFVGGAVAGSADLVLRKACGELAILDLKWSSRRYEEQLAQARHLQLAVYGELLRQETGTWPDVAYFGLANACLMAPDAGFFPQARVLPPPEGESTALLWRRFVAGWRWRRGQLDAGAIEVVAKDIEATPESLAPEDALAPQAAPEGEDDYRWLTGWED